MTMRERARAHVGAVYRKRRPLPPPLGAQGVDLLAWELVVDSLERLRPGHLDGERALLDAFVDAHVRILEAIAERSHAGGRSS